MKMKLPIAFEAALESRILFHEHIIHLSDIQLFTQVESPGVMHGVMAPPPSKRADVVHDFLHVVRGESMRPVCVLALHVSWCKS